MRGRWFQARPCRRPCRPTPVRYAALLCLASFGAVPILTRQAPRFGGTNRSRQNRSEPPATAGDNDPYPNLATVPPKPPAADTATWNRGEHSPSSWTESTRARQRHWLPFHRRHQRRPPARPVVNRLRTLAGDAGKRPVAHLVGQHRLQSRPPRPPPAGFRRDMPPARAGRSTSRGDRSACRNGNCPPST